MNGYPYIRDPASWPGRSFTLHDAEGKLLVPLPPTLLFTEPLGQSDPYTWDRSPGSAEYFPLGDGLPDPGNPPKIAIGGEWRYRTCDEAIAHCSDVARLLPGARQLHWRGRKLADLRDDIPGFYTFQFGLRASVTHTLDLRPATDLDAAALSTTLTTPLLDYTNLVTSTGTSNSSGGSVPWYRDSDGNIIIANMEKAADR